jgi:hypothetical protein
MERGGGIFREEIILYIERDWGVAKTPTKSNKKFTVIVRLL